MCKLIFSIILFPAFYSGAALASPDELNICKADSNAHQLLCKNIDPEAVNNIEIKYKKINSTLSERGKLLFLDDVRSWFNFASTICRRDKEVNFNFLETEKECIENRYRDRMKDLDNYILRKKGFLLNRISSFKAHDANSDDATGWNQGYVTVEFSYLQIDKPQSKSIKNFNLLSKKTARNFVDNEENTDYIVNYELLNISPELISIAVNRSKLSHDAPHGEHDFKIIHWLILKKRTLNIKDIFTSPTTVQKVIAKKCNRILLKRKYHENYSIMELGKIAMNIDRWQIKRNGIVINFKFDEVAPYSEGEPGVFIPWSQLNSYLNKTFSFSIKQLPAR